MNKTNRVLQCLRCIALTAGMDNVLKYDILPLGKKLKFHLCFVVVRVKTPFPVLGKSSTRGKKDIRYQSIDHSKLDHTCCVLYVLVNGTHEILNAVLTIGRADLSARDASHGSDRKIMETTKARFRENLPESKKIISNKTPSNRWAVGSTVFSHGEEFHRQTGELRREVKEKPTASGGTQGTRCPEDKVSRCVEDSTEIGAPYRGYKVTWFCAALAKTAEHISGAERRVRAKAFLFNVFEGFDK